MAKKSLGAKTLIVPTPTWVVGTYDRDGKPNVMTAAWAGVCCSSPPSLAVSLRKATYSYLNIVERRAFSVNVPSERHVKEADFFGIASGRTTDKFQASGLTPVRCEKVDAPYVAEFPLVVECKLIHMLEIGLHTLFVGEILDVKADEEVLDADSSVDIEKVRPFVYSPARRVYHGIGTALGHAFSIGKP